MSNKRKCEESDSATPVKVRKVYDELIFHCDPTLLVVRGAKVDQPMDDDATPTPLLIASQNGHTKCMELLLDRGAKVDQPNDNGATPLFIASQNGHTKCMELLLEHGAK
eukprot:gene21219-8018_t